jgi:hypothetical protein
MTRNRPSLKRRLLCAAEQTKVSGFTCTRSFIFSHVELVSALYLVQFVPINPLPSSRLLQCNRFLGNNDVSPSNPGRVEPPRITAEADS